MTAIAPGKEPVVTEANRPRRRRDPRQTPLKRVSADVVTRVLVALADHALLVTDQISEIVGRGLSRQRMGDILAYVGSDFLAGRPAAKVDEGLEALVAGTEDRSLGLIACVPTHLMWEKGHPNQWFLTDLGAEYVRQLAGYEDFRPTKVGRAPSRTLTAHHWLGTNEVGRVFSSAVRERALAQLPPLDLPPSASEALVRAAKAERLEVARSSMSVSWVHERPYRFAPGTEESSDNTVRPDALLTVAFQAPPPLGPDVEFRFFVECDRNTGESLYDLGRKLLAYRAFADYPGETGGLAWQRSLVGADPARPFGGLPVLLIVFAGGSRNSAYTRTVRTVKLVRDLARFPGLDGAGKSIGVLACTMWDLVEQGPFAPIFVEVFGQGGVRWRSAFDVFQADARSLLPASELASLQRG